MSDIRMFLKSMQICSIRKTEPVIFVQFMTNHTSISNVMYWHIVDLHRKTFIVRFQLGSVLKPSFSTEQPLSPSCTSWS